MNKHTKKQKDIKIQSKQERQTDTNRDRQNEIKQLTQNNIPKERQKERTTERHTERKRERKKDRNKADERNIQRQRERKKGAQTEIRASNRKKARMQHMKDRTTSERQTDKPDTSRQE